MKNISFPWLRVTILFVLCLSAYSRSCGSIQQKTQNEHIVSSDTLYLTLQDCLDIALKNNKLLRVSEMGISIAQAQHKQALSSYWPQINLQSAIMHLDQAPNFIFPEETSTYSIRTSLVPGQPEFEMISTVTVPEKDVKLMDRTSFITSIGMVLPLYTGGLRKSLTKQTRSGMAIAQQERRRAELKVIHDVKKVFYGLVLAKQIKEIGSNTLERLQVLLELSENAYQKGSGKVTKTDYLKNKILVESVRSLVIRLNANVDLARSALVLMMGMNWESQIRITDKEIPYQEYTGDRATLIGKTYSFNPDWAKLMAGLNALDGQIDQAKSAYFPKIALTGNLMHIENGYNAGMMSKANKHTWTVGIGLQLPLFNGFRTHHQIREAKARWQQLNENKMRLKEGLALQVQHAMTNLLTSQEQNTAVTSALQAATDNRRLNERAYQEDIIEMQPVIEAQIIESVMQAQAQKTKYDHILARISLEFIIGTELNRLLEIRQ